MSLNVHLTKDELCECCGRKLNLKIEHAKTVICELCKQNCYHYKYAICNKCNKIFCSPCINKIDSGGVNEDTRILTHKFKCRRNSDDKLLEDTFDLNLSEECDNLIVFYRKMV